MSPAQRTEVNPWMERARLEVEETGKIFVDTQMALREQGFDPEELEESFIKETL